MSRRFRSLKPLVSLLGVDWRAGASAAALAAWLPAAAQAETTVKNPWVRATVVQQKSTGAFMEISSTRATRLLSVASPVAQQVEIHEMKMDGDVMRMAAVSGLDLPAGVSVALRPGGLHLMMTGLKSPLRAGAEVPLTLVLQSKDGRKETIELKALVRPLADVPESRAASQR